MESNTPKEGLNKNVLVVSISVVIICLVISGTILYSRSNSPNAVNNNLGKNTTAALGHQDSTVDVAKVKIDNQPFYGNASAPVVVAEWFDYQCPFCRKTDKEVLPQLINDYVKTGKVKIAYKDFAFLGSDSETAAMAGRAVWEVAPDKFEQWHEAMFDKQAGENSGWASRANILALTKSLGIDSVKVDQLMTSKASEYQKAIDADKTEASNFGISGTPSFIIGKQLIIGAQPYSVLQSAVDAQLNTK